MTAASHAIVDLAALARNYRKVCTEAAPAEVGCVVKADAYGLGAGPVATALRAAGCRRFFVATAREGIELRRLLGSREERIFVLDGPVGATVGDFARHALIPVLNTAEQVRLWSIAGPAALHVDTGMRRLGLEPAEAIAFATRPAGSAAGAGAGGAGSAKAASGAGDAGGIVLLMTHLACADEPDHPLNAAQADEFGRISAAFPGVPTSIGNSAGAFLDASTRGDLVRAGIVLYGGNPFVGRASPSEVVVSFRAPVIQVRRLERAGPVGYGATYVAAAGTALATVAVGYADGYPRSLGNRGVVAVHGTRVPVVGRVSMDLITLDVTAVEAPVREGDDVELFGHVVSVDEVAMAAGTISYELLSRLGRRVERRYVGAAAEIAAGRAVGSEQAS